MSTYFLGDLNQAPKALYKLKFFSTTFRADNAPSGSNYWVGFTVHQQGTGASSPFFTQVAFSTSGDIIASRSFNNNTWSDWKKIELT